MKKYVRHTRKTGRPETSLQNQVCILAEKLLRRNGKQERALALRYGETWEKRAAPQLSLALPRSPQRGRRGREGRRGEPRKQKKEAQPYGWTS